MGIFSPAYEDPSTPKSSNFLMPSETGGPVASRESSTHLNETLQSDDYEYFTNNEALFGKRTCGVVCDMS